MSDLKESPFQAGADLRQVAENYNMNNEINLRYSDNNSDISSLNISKKNGLLYLVVRKETFQDITKYSISWMINGTIGCGVSDERLKNEAKELIDTINFKPEIANFLKEDLKVFVTDNFRNPFSSVVGF